MARDGGQLAGGSPAAGRRVAPAGPGQAQLAALGQEGGYGVLLWLDAGGAAAESLADTRCLVTVRLKQLVDF